ncbi:hypothetical protein HAL013_02880 [Helicobacter ailurogastricus]|uniref:Uncharacterized protein n=1 Tax=Helicobacter ailurogastricus TaxID=1578720 RepID=A0A0K2XBP4_9HELI|nr:hypothetical protein HAL013_02880 [Helicobacter ailurogastricus]
MLDFRILLLEWHFKEMALIILPRSIPVSVGSCLANFQKRASLLFFTPNIGTLKKGDHKPIVLANNALKMFFSCFLILKNAQV